jgi:exodeoxyribonuclease X
MNALFDDAIILDTETTDREDGEVIELAWLESANTFDPEAMVRTQQERFAPSRPSTFGALATHNILDHELIGKRASALAPTALPPVHYWIGHNIDFDWRALGGDPSVFRICTLALARKWMPELDSHSLGACLYAVRGRNESSRNLVQSGHGALADVLMTQILLHHLLKLTGCETLSGLYAESEDARVPRRWSFGKFEDEPISAADRGYVGWFLKNCRDRPDFAYYCIALRRVGLMA